MIIGIPKEIMAHDCRVAAGGVRPARVFVLGAGTGDSIKGTRQFRLG